MHVYILLHAVSNLQQYIVGKKTLNKWKFLLESGKKPPLCSDLEKKPVNSVVVSGFTLQMICRYLTLIIV